MSASLSFALSVGSLNIDLMLLESLLWENRKHSNMPSEREEIDNCVWGSNSPGRRRDKLTTLNVVV